MRLDHREEDGTQVGKKAWGKCPAFQMCEPASLTPAIPSPALLLPRNLFSSYTSEFLLVPPLRSLPWFACITCFLPGDMRLSLCVFSELLPQLYHEVPEATDGPVTRSQTGGTYLHGELTQHPHCLGTHMLLG